MILRFRQTMYLETQIGGFVDERQCVEHPRLVQLQQRSREGNPVMTIFMVNGIAKFFDSIDKALDALRMNPRPGDILAVPPWEVVRDAVGE